MMGTIINIVGWVELICWCWENLKVVSGHSWEMGAVWASAGNCAAPSGSLELGPHAFNLNL